MSGSRLMRLPEAENGQLAQLTANLQAGSSTYDVIAMDVIWTAKFASAGWIIPLESSMFHLGDFLRPAVDTAMYNGHLWAVPYYSNAEVLYYRKDILAKAGKLPPKTWAQLAAGGQDGRTEVRACKATPGNWPRTRGLSSTSPTRSSGAGPSSPPGGK